MVRSTSATSPTCWPAGSSIECVNFREHTPLSGGQVDDTPFGGGRRDGAAGRRHGRARCGRTTAVDPVELRARAGGSSRSRPAGACSTTRSSTSSPPSRTLTLLCGRYEGFDERIVEHFASDVVSIGRYVLSGGELGGDGPLRRGPAQAAGGARPRAVGGSRSPSARPWKAIPSIPHYTRPAEYRGWRVPDVLLSGHHERIERWRRERSRERGEAASGGEPQGPGRSVRRAARPVRYHGRSRRCRAPLRLHPGRAKARPPSSHEQRHRNHRARAAAPRPKLLAGRPREGPLPGGRGHAAAACRSSRASSSSARATARARPSRCASSPSASASSACSRVHSPKIERIELAARGDVRRAKLYYLRDRVGKRARVRERRYTGPEEIVEPGLLHPEEPEARGAGTREAHEADAPSRRRPPTRGAGAPSTARPPQRRPPRRRQRRRQTRLRAESESEPASDAGEADDGHPAGDQPA